MKRYQVKLKLSNNVMVRTVVFAENSTDATIVAQIQFNGTTLIGQPEEVSEE